MLQPENWLSLTPMRHLGTVGMSEEYRHFQWIILTQWPSDGGTFAPAAARQGKTHRLSSLAPYCSSFLLSIA